MIQEQHPSHEAPAREDGVPTRDHLLALSPEMIEAGVKAAWYEGGVAAIFTAMLKAYVPSEGDVEAVARVLEPNAWRLLDLQRKRTDFFMGLEAQREVEGSRVLARAAITALIVSDGK